MLFTPRLLGFAGILAALISSACAAPVQTPITPASRESPPLKYTVEVVDAKGNPLEANAVAPEALYAIKTSLTAIHAVGTQGPKPIIEHLGKEVEEKHFDPTAPLAMVFYKVKAESVSAKFGQKNEECFAYVVVSEGRMFGSVVVAVARKIHWVFQQPVTDKTGLELRPEQFKKFYGAFPPVQAWGTLSSISACMLQDPKVLMAMSAGTVLVKTA
ncbi:hypothetical protein BDP27DRAFT_519257 [Rhodocollybia butyracea]|uniref:Uncharacterized protein n=1 Tax=Rhodocollybia butyracea TaxID=206335 RepID=A0A9P5U9Y2_9AGAR|nr:hypothetical protein BDP27DRAFT_519257 [Rhodocollybia butyracea]